MRYKFEFESKDAQVILNALSDQPYRQVKDLIYDIHMQVSNQTKIEEISAVVPKDKEENK